MKFNLFENNSFKMQLKSNSKLIIFLGILAISSIFLKLYSIDLELPLYKDNLDLTMRAFAHLDGNFEVSPNRNFGWSIFQSPFLLLTNSENFLDYSKIIRLLGIGVSTSSIFLMYFLSRKFFNQKYSLASCSLFAFYPQLNQISGLGQTEPLFIMSIMASLLFILRKNNDKLIFFSFMLAGIAYSIRPMGMIIIIVLIIIYLINFKKNLKPLKFLLCIAIFILIILPISVVRYDQYGDPLYYGDVSKGFVSTTSMLNAINVESTSASEFINNEGIYTFFELFIVSGIINSIKGIFAVSFPYLLFLIPVGILLSFKTKPEIKKFILSNWILIISYGLSLTIVSAIVLSPRFFLPLIPFLIIFSILPIQKLCNLQINFKNYQNISLIVIISLILSISVYYTITEFSSPDKQLEDEKLEFSRYLHDNLDGNFFNAGWATHYFKYVEIIDNNQFKSYYLNTDNRYSDIEWLRLYGTSVEDILNDGQSLGLNYLVIEDKQYALFFLDDLYEDEKSYPYLTKIYDSNDVGMKKLNVKIFKINYEEFFKYMD
tara:strand:- start:10052 stop:11686 length:1635 start_codon:yes stop_codon:yes gene_type:complete